MDEEMDVAVRFPYYVIPDIEKLSSSSEPDELRMHRRRIAANIGDPDALRAILGDASEDFHDFYRTSDLPKLSTSDTIDSFLQKLVRPTACLPLRSVKRWCPLQLRWQTTRPYLRRNSMRMVRLSRL